MPTKPPTTTQRLHAMHPALHRDDRPTASARGYDGVWQRVRFTYPNGSGVPLLIGLASASCYVYCNNNAFGISSTSSIPWGSSPPYSPDGGHNVFGFDGSIGGFRTWSSVASGSMTVDDALQIGTLLGSKVGNTDIPTFVFGVADTSISPEGLVGTFIVGEAWALTWDFTY